MNFPFLLALFLGSCLTAFLLLRAIISVWNRFGILDRPHLYKSEQGRKPAPYSAGVLVFFTLLAMAPWIYIFGDFSPLLERRFTIVLIIGALLNIITFIDDMDTIGKSPVKVPPIVRL